MRKSQKSRRLSLAAACIAACAGAAAIPAAAPAASLEYTATSGDPDYYYLYKASRGEKNRLRVINGKRTVTFIDRGAKRIRKAKGSFSGCSFKQRTRVVCKSRAKFQIFLGDRNDSLSFKGRPNGTSYGVTSTTQAASAYALQELYYVNYGFLDEHLLVRGGAGNDNLRGTRNDDTIVPGPGRDRVDGGRGGDLIEDTPDGAADSLRGGRGVDTIDAGGRAPVAIDLEKETLAAGAEIDTLDSFERAHGGDGNDTLTGSPGAELLSGDGGDDAVSGGDGTDWVSGDLPPPAGPGGGVGTDSLTGGAGDDILDARELPTDDQQQRGDTLRCGLGADTIAAQTNDFADQACELSAFGRFNGPIYGESTPQRGVFPDATVALAPVRTEPDGSPTYSIGCPATGHVAPANCRGRVQLEAPPADGPAGTPAVLGSGSFEIPPGERRDVTVALNEAGKAALARGDQTAVHVLSGTPADGSVTQAPEADFGWQQVIITGG